MGLKRSKFISQFRIKVPADPVSGEGSLPVEGHLLAGTSHEGWGAEREREGERDKVRERERSGEREGEKERGRDGKRALISRRNTNSIMSPTPPMTSSNPN